VQLLVSVRNAEEARAALEGGADIIDAKEPAAGALGPVTSVTLAAIRRAVPEAIPLSAALGDVAVEPDIAESLGRTGVPLAFVKLGFLGIGDPESVARLLGLAVKLAGEAAAGPRIVAVAYADWQQTGSLEPARFPEILQRSGAHGLLIDTATKGEGTLFDFAGPEALAGIGRALRRQGSLYAIAGSLDPGNLIDALRVEADIIGVRGAVTDGGRNGTVSIARTARLAAALRGTGALSPAAPDPAFRLLQ
jgi:uncharacterized protein (UPF0264 family)